MSRERAAGRLRPSEVTGVEFLRSLNDSYGTWRPSPPRAWYRCSQSRVVANHARTWRKEVSGRAQRDGFVSTSLRSLPRPASGASLTRRGSPDHRHGRE